MNNRPSTGSIGIIPSFSMVVLAVGLMNHVMVIPPLLQDAKRDAWVSTLAIILPAMLWTIILFYIMKNTNQQALMPWLQQHCGKIICMAFRLYFIIYLFLISAITVKDTVMWTHTSYLPRTPQVVLAISIVLLCCFAAHFGIRAIAITSGILVPFVVVFGDFVMSSNLPAKNYSLLTPVMENGVLPILKGCIYVGGGLAELIIILLFQHQIKSKVRLWSLCALSMFLILLVFGPVTGAIAEFGPVEAGKLRYPAFEEWRLVKIGKYIRHVDFLSIYQWLSGAFVRISVSALLLVDLLPFSKHKKYSSIFLCILGALLVILVELPISDMQFLRFLKQIYLPLSLAVSSGMLLILFAAVVLQHIVGVKYK